MDSLRRRPTQSETFKKDPAFPRETFTPSPSASSPRVTENVTRRRPRRFLGFFFGFLLVFLGCLLALYFLGGVTLTRSIHFENRTLSFFQSLEVVGKSLFQKSSPLEGENDGRINVLLLGRAGEHYPGKNLTDTVMLLSLDTHEKKAALLSLPRDLFIPIAGTETSTKLNSLYQIGINNGDGMSLMRKSIEAAIGIPIHYYASVDFDGFEKVVDALGGIQVDVVRDFHDPSYPGKNYSYETFDIHAGWQRLDGATALKYARERHNDPEGDFGRAKRQQQILQAFVKKAFSIPTFVNPFTLHSLLESLGESITTDVAPEELERFIAIGRNYDLQNISTVVVDAWKKDSLLRVDHIDTPSGRAFILVPKSGQWDDIQSLARNIFDRSKTELQSERVSNEKATLTIFTAPSKISAAEMLKKSIENEYALENIKLFSLPALEKATETAMIVDKTGLAKPYTLDALLKRYNLEKNDTLPVLTPKSTPPSDFFLLYTKSDFNDDSQNSLEASSDPAYDFQEPLPPQPNKK